mmetsp:Transcript_74668/g.150222  ORF Transcript_74668/g.150222 Transcript_74668/m.150222 type:complete len:210 (-) Transcript_74668:179-808(-)
MANGSRVECRRSCGGARGHQHHVGLSPRTHAQPLERLLRQTVRTDERVQRAWGAQRRVPAARTDDFRRLQVCAGQVVGVLRAQPPQRQVLPARPHGCGLPLLRAEPQQARGEDAERRGRVSCLRRATAPREKVLLRSLARPQRSVGAQVLHVRPPRLRVRGLGKVLPGGVRHRPLDRRAAARDGAEHGLALAARVLQAPPAADFGPKRG